MELINFFWISSEKGLESLDPGGVDCLGKIFDEKEFESFHVK